MDTTRAIQMAVARADMLLCALRAVPWGRIGLSLLLTAAVLRVIKAVRKYE